MTSTMANVKIKNPDAVIFDYNTIVSNAFVENQLMPYFETAHEDYFDANWSKEECQADLKALAAAAAEDAAAPKVDLTAPKQAQIDAVNKYIEYCGTADKENSKAFILYRFHVWFDGYKRGKITTPVYSDVAVHIQKWATELKLYVLSNSWAEASRKFLQKTSDGDLNALIAKQFDTSLGQLTSPATYQNLIAKTKDQPANTVFLTMGIDEAQAAKAAGLQVVLVLTHSEEVDGITDTVKDIPIARSLAQIEFVVSPDLRKHLVVTEGNSASNSIIVALNQTGTDCYDVFPIGGLFLNVRNECRKVLNQDKFIAQLMEKVGLKFGQLYKTTNEKNALNYASIVMCFDPDLDGIILSGLFLNLFHCLWPQLLYDGFIQELKMPVITLRSYDQPLVDWFYTKSDYEKWLREEPLNLSLNLKVREHFNLGNYKTDEMESLLLILKPIAFSVNSQDDDLFEKAYSNQQITERKCWLQAEMLKLNSATDESKSVYSNATIHLSFKDFVSNDLVQAFISVIERCIPSIIFGVKPIHQKIIEFGKSLSEGDQLRVCDYAGEMATRSGYQHSLVILGKIITRIGRNTNGNLSILETIGCFGSQGIDAASDRYISTKVTSLGRLLFNSNLPPILPVFMLNGVKGCAYGFKVQIPCYAVDDLINKTRQKLRGEQISSFTPSYQHHNGKLVKLSAKGDFISFGVIEQINNTTILIKLLPLEKTAEKYKEKVLIPMLTSSKITSFKPAKRNSGFFILTLNEKSLQDAKQNGILTSFQLQTKFSASLSLIDSKGSIKEYGDTETMFNDWFEATLEVFCKHFDNPANAKQEWQELLTLLESEISSTESD